MKKKNQESSSNLMLEELLQEEKEKSRNNKIKNRPILVITYTAIAMFMALFVYIVYFIQFKSEHIIANPRNVRQDSFADVVERGDIITSDGVVIATSATDEHGNTNRTYPHGNMFAHLVGYHGYGNAGLELQGNFYMLRSHINIFERVTNEMAGNKNRGDNLITTVNYNLQEIAYNALGGCNGAVIVMEPDTGKVLAMVSKPDYDPNNIDVLWEYLSTEEGSKSTVLLNRATQGIYAPGSTFKIVTLLEYYRENPTTYDQYSYTCEGSTIVNSINMHCYNNHVHGTISLADSLAYSCNTSFTNMGTTLNYASYRKTAEELLFNKELPYDGEYKKSSFVIDANSDPNELPQTSIGQGDTGISPLHNAMIVSAIANGGVLMKPYLMQSVENDDGSNIKTFAPKKSETLVTHEEATFLTEYMKGVCTYGTAAQYFAGLSYQVAGKTGTAEIDNEGNSNSWFVGFSNPDNPDIVVSVVVEDYSTNGVSATAIAKKLFDAYYASDY